MRLSDWQNHFRELYGRRNRLFLPSLTDRLGFLMLSVSDLQHALRQNMPEDLLQIALSRVISRLFCVADHFWNLSVAATMARKYPSERCVYCLHQPCDCRLEKRGGANIGVAYQMQCERSLTRVCQDLDTLYGETNRQKGSECVVNRLFREVGELMSPGLQLPHLSGTMDVIEEQFAFEMADILAWTIAVSNLLRIDLESAVYQRFGNGCWNCHYHPCACTGFDKDLVRWQK